MTDLKSLKAGIDLRLMVEQELGRPVSRSAKAWSFKCPFHNEQHGASLAIYADGWQCFGACQTGGDAITWVMARQGVDFKEAVRLLGGDLTKAIVRQASPPRSLKVAQPPPQSWQEAGREVVDYAVKTLWSEAGFKAFEYLTKIRCLPSDLVREARLGYVPGHYERWRKITGLAVPCGIIIPWFADDQLWAIKARRAGGDIRYQQVAGGHQSGACYWIDNLTGRKLAMLVEGEFNCLIAYWALLFERVSPVSLGSAGYSIDPRWYGRLAMSETLYGLFDPDKAGDGARARQSLVTSTSRLKLLAMPPGIKDLNDFWVGCQKKGDSEGLAIVEWFRSEKERVSNANQLDLAARPCQPENG